MEKVSSILGSVFGGGGGGGVAAEPSATITSIFIYPIKSCRGISVSQAPITSTGFRWDRQWVVVNDKGRARTQRVEPKLALVEVELPTEAFNEGWEPTDTSYLVIRAPGMEVLKVSLSKTCEIINDITVWEWSGSALDEGAEASEWFSTYLGKSCRLVRFNAASESRAVDPEYARGYRTMFSDEYPFMLLSQGSLNALNELLEEPVPINRFRPNILVDGCDPFSEDLWTEIKINKTIFHGVKLCARCKVPTINQENGISGPEPTETLMKIRSDQVIRPTKKQGGKVYFGQNLVCRDSLSEGKGKVLQVGDPIYVFKKVSSAADARA
ncbi:Molybdenum cofactor sulfurase [Macleaya cordata]|uniref:Molybdenum cofactor sulfurase n=1 Tax=Macleaya cordata TaxID=56857 RepID=A0A200QQK0_MACCD|nr:Molybdenum cofactor sulfurase [Macleaya cordata]